MTERVKAIFELGMEDEFYQHLLERVEANGEYILPVHHGITVRKPEG